MTDLNELGLVHMAGESTSPTTLQFCTSLSAQSGTVFHSVRLIASMLHGMSLSLSNLMSFMLPKIVCILLKINFHALYAVGFFLGLGVGGSLNF